MGLWHSNDYVLDRTVATTFRLQADRVPAEGAHNLSTYLRSPVMPTAAVLLIVCLCNSCVTTMIYGEDVVAVHAVTRAQLRDPLLSGQPRKQEFDFSDCGACIH